MSHFFTNYFPKILSKNYNNYNTERLGLQMSDILLPQKVWSYETCSKSTKEIRTKLKIKLERFCGVFIIS